MREGIWVVIRIVVVSLEASGETHAAVSIIVERSDK